MADYYSILNKFISGLPDNSESNRSIVYKKARTTIESQLRSKEPAPSEEAIAAQMTQLDEAIAKIELENSPAIAEPVTENIAEDASEQVAEAEPVAQEAAVPEPETVSIEPVSETPATTQVPETEVQTTPPESVQAPVVEQEPETVAPVVESATKVVEKTAETVVEEAPAAAAAIASGEVVAPMQASVEPIAEIADTSVEIAEPEVAVAPISAPEPSVEPAVAAPPSAPVAQPAAPETVSHVPPVDMGTQMPDAESSGSGILGKTIPYVLALAIIGGGGYALWANKEPLLGAMGIDANELFSSSEEKPLEEESAEQPTQESDQAEIAEPEQPVSEPENTTDKEPVRIGSDGEDVEANPVTPGSDTSSGETEIPLILDEQSSENTEPEAEQTAIEPVEEADLEEADNASTTEAPATEPAAPLIGETAFLYEEGSDGSSASRNDGSVEWSLLKESPDDGSPAESVIQGTLEVPDKAVTMTMKLRRNADQALPASHIIELTFTTSDSFSGGVVDSVARFVMKPSEEARGEGLIAVPARIDAGLFLIALNNLDQAVETNKRLLTDMDWIDIPLGYSTGRRALVTMTKGEQGKKVFAEAFADWANR